MSEIPEEIRCQFDAEKVCPLLAAVSAVRAMHDAPAGERPSITEYVAALDQAEETLSGQDLERFHAMTDPGGIREDLRPNTCKMGPHRVVPLVGKMSCGATAINYVRRAQSPSPAESPS